MAEGKIRVKFEAKNAPELIAAVKALNQQTKRLGLETKKTTTKTKELNVTQERQNRNTEALNKSLFGLGGKVAMVRAKFLLYAFAIRQATQFIGGMIKEAKAFEGVRRSFDQLAFSTDLSADSFEKLSDATNNTVSSLDIMKQANNAMLLGIADSTEQMAEMFEISHKLAKAVGKDATFGMESLTTGIGRQSRLMLDNLGIIVIAEKAYKKHADALDKNASELTDAEKKQAFLNEAMTQAREMASLLPAPIDDATDKFNQLSASLADAQVTFGEMFAESGIVNLALDSLKNLSELMTAERIHAYVKVLELAGAAMLFYSIQAKIAVFWQTKLGWVKIAVGIGVAIEALLEYTDILDRPKEPIKALLGETQKYMKALGDLKRVDLQAELTTLSAQLTTAEKDFKDTGEQAKQTLKDVGAIGDVAITGIVSTEAIETGNETLVILQDLRKNTHAFTQKQKILNKAQTEQNDIVLDANVISREEEGLLNLKIARLKELIEALGGSTLSYNEFTEAQIKANDLFKKTDEGQREAIVALIDWTKANKDAFDSTTDFKAVLAMLADQLEKFDEQITPLKEKFEELFKVDPDVLQETIGAFSNMSSAISASVDARMNHELEALRATDAFKDASTKKQKKMEADKTAEFTNLRKTAWVAEKASNLASAGMNISLAYTKALSQGGGLFGIPLASLVAALGAVQLVAIASTPMPKFAQGGLIGGKRHSSGGTNINAESGEFVMSRNAVSSIGVENLNKMNQGASGGGGSVTVNINGGLITPEFVENDLAEAIREGARRGANFGIS